MQRLIDADAVISGVKNRCIGQNDVVKVEHSIISMLYMMPTIEAEPVRHGKWLRISPAKIYECSECGQNVMTDDIECYAYCQHCGARMDEE